MNNPTEPKALTDMTIDELKTHQNKCLSKVLSTNDGGYIDYKDFWLGAYDRASQELRIKQYPNIG
jgi:hypothetical protein